jgi:hypothetical protein
MEYPVFFPMARQPLGGLGRLIFEASRSHFRHTTLGRTPLDEGPARRRDLYLTTLNTHKRLTSMPPVGYFFFFACPGFFPFDPFMYCLNHFVLHVTLRSMLPSLQQTQHKYPCPGGIRTHDPSKRAAEHPRLRPHGHWDRPRSQLPLHYFRISIDN